jgi:hypothetical protein
MGRAVSDVEPGADAARHAMTIKALAQSRGIPRRHHEAVRDVVISWVTSWRGATPTGATPDDALAYLARMAEWGR